MQVKIVITFTLVLCLCFNVFAVDLIDMEETGSVIVLMEYQDQAVSGGTLTIYHVATPIWTGNQYVFEHTQPFANCDLPLTDLLNKELTAQYSEFAIDNALVGMTERIDMDGQARFDDLPLGLYLIVQEEAAAGYFPFEPFFICVPMQGKDGWIYDVDATPKIDLEREPQPDEPPTPPDIPDTGQLKWPIPVLAIAGVVLFALGWALCFRRKSKKDET